LASFPVRDNPVYVEAQSVNLPSSLADFLGAILFLRFSFFRFGFAAG
jgi:hypothetical protein